MGKAVDAAIGRIEAAEGLDKPGHMLGRAISRTGQVAGRPSKRLANALHGRPYGHPVHPIAVTVPIGTWTLAFGLDLLAAVGLLRDRGASRAADLALKEGGGRRRRRHCHRRRRLAAPERPGPPGWVGARDRQHGGYLGGHLVHRRRAAVDHANRSPESREFKPVLPFSELRDKVPHRVSVWDEAARQEVGIVLVKEGERVHARKLETMLDDERASRFRRAFRELKISLLEGV